jgi:hypothetical protein
MTDSDFWELHQQICETTCTGCGEPMDEDGNCENWCSYNEQVIARMRKSRSWDH